MSSNFEYLEELKRRLMSTRRFDPGLYRVKDFYRKCEHCPYGRGAAFLCAYERLSSLVGETEEQEELKKEEKKKESTEEERKRLACYEKTWKRKSSSFEEFFSAHTAAHST